MPSPAPISDEEASNLFNSYDSAPPDQQPQIAAQLAQYRDQTLQAQQQATDDHFEKLYTDPKYFDSVSKSGLIDAAAKVSPFPDALRYRAANQAYLAHVLGVDTDQLNATYEAQRDGYAKANFGATGPVTDQAFFNGVAKQQQQKIDTRNALNEIPADIVAARMDALGSDKPQPSTAELVQAWKDRNASILPQSKDGEESAVLGAAQKFFQDQDPWIEQHAGTLRTIFDSLKSQAQGKPQGNAQSVDALSGELASMPPDDRQKLYGLVALYAQKNGQDAKGYFQQLGESIARSVETTGHGVANGASESVLLGYKNALESGQLASPEEQFGPFAKVLDMTPEERAAEAQNVQHQLDAIQVSRELRAVGNGTIDPIRPLASGWMGNLEQGSYSLAGAAPLLATSIAQPEVGIPLAAAALSANEYDRIRLQYPNVPIDQASTMAVVSGGAQAALMGLTAATTLGKLPITGKFLDSLAAPSTSLAQSWAKIGMKSALSGAELVAQGEAANATPMLVDGVAKALGADMPQYDWNKELSDFKNAQPATLFSMLPLWLIGSGAIGFHEAKGWDAISRSADALTQKTGIDPKDAAQIAATSDPAQRSAIFQKAWSKVPEETKQIIIQRADAESQAAQAAQQSPSKPTLTSEMGQDEHGAPQQQWVVCGKDGSEVYRTTDADAAITAYNSQASHEARQVGIDFRPQDEEAGVKEALTTEQASAPEVEKPTEASATKEEESQPEDKYTGEREVPVVVHQGENLRTLSDAEDFLREKAGQPIHNEATDTDFTISKNSASKFVNDSAVRKSTSEDAHLAAIKNIDELTRVAEPITRADRNGDPNISKVHDFYAPMEFNGQIHRVKITAKEFENPKGEKRLYSVEAVRVETPGIDTAEAALEPAHDAASERGAGSPSTIKVSDLIPESISKDDQKQIVSGLADQARKDITNFGPGAANSAEFEHSYAVVGLEHLLEGKTDKAEWMDAMRAEYDYFDDAKLNDIWNRSQKMLRDFQKGERGREISAKSAIEKNAGVKKPVEKVSVNPVTQQKRELRAAEKAGAAGYKRGVREAWQEARQQMAALKDQLRASVSKAKALAEYFRGMQKGSKIGADATRRQLAMADKWLAADVEHYRRMLVDYVNKALPVSERGRFLGLVTSALERPALLTGDREKLYNAMVGVTEAVDSRVHELYRQGLADEIRDIAARALKSPTVDLNAKSVLERMLKDINLKNPRKSTLESLSKTAEYLARMRDEGKDVDMPRSVLARLTMLAKTPLDDLSTASLENIHTKVQLAESIGRTAYKSRAARWNAEKSARMDAMLSGPSHPMEVNTLVRPQPGEKLTGSEKLQNRIASILNTATSLDLGVLPQDVIFDMLQRGRGSYAGPLFDQVRTPIDAAFEAAMLRYNEVKSGLREIITRNKLGEQSSERIGLWAALHQEGGERRALESGVTQETIDKLKSEGLTDAEAEAYGYMRQQLDATLPDIQGIMHQLYNVAVEPVKNYFPYMREWEAYKPDVESPIRDAVTGETVSPDELSAFSQLAGNFYTQGSSKLPNGFTLERKENAGGPIRFDAFEVFERHMVNAARLVEMQRELKMVGELVRSDAFGAKYGTLGQKLINEWLGTVANDGGGQSVNRWRWLDKLNRGTSRSMVFFNLVSNIKHISAIPMGVVNAGGARWWWQGMHLAMSKAGEDFIKQFPQVAERNAGELSMAQFQALVEKTKDSVPAQLLAFADKWGFSLGKKIDELNSQSVFLGRYLSNLEAAGKAPTLDGPVNMKAAANALSFMRRTVSSTHGKDLPATLARGTGPFGGNVSVARAFFQFHQFVLERWSQMRYDLPQSAAAGNYAKFAAMIAASSAAVAYETNIKNAVDHAVAMAWGGMTGHAPQEKKDTEGPAARAMWDVAGLIPYSSPIISSIRFHQTGIPIVDAFTDAGYAAGRVASAKDSKQKQKAAIDAVGAVAQVAGVPGAGVAAREAKKAVSQE